EMGGDAEVLRTNPDRRKPANFPMTLPMARSRRFSRRGRDRSTLGRGFNRRLARITMRHGHIRDFGASANPDADVARPFSSTCACRKSDSAILVMKAAEDRL